VSEITIFILLFALVADWYWGELEILWSRFPHPVVMFGKAVSFVDKRFNLEKDGDALRYRKGAFSVSGLILIAVVLGILLQVILAWLGVFGWIIEGFIVFTLLAQRSLMSHVSAVADGLRNEGLEGGRKAVGMIVGRDTSYLERSSVSRASIESLAENFSDGVVAPAFWYALLGLPGILAYKMINTADSMIGYHSERYEYFGKTTAQIDDLANWVPARLSALLIAVGTFFIKGFTAARYALSTAIRDAGLHRSPNAGWPESAMAGSLGVALGGPRVYPNETVQQAFLNASGKRNLDAVDIEKAVVVCERSFFTLVGFVALGAIFFS